MIPFKKMCQRESARRANLKLKQQFDKFNKYDCLHVVYAQRILNEEYDFKQINPSCIIFSCCLDKNTTCHVEADGSWFVNNKQIKIDIHTTFEQIHKQYA